MQSEVNSMYSRFSIAISSRSGRAGSRERSGQPAPCFHLETVWSLKCKFLLVRGQSQILCKHRRVVENRAKIFRAAAAQPVAALSTT